MKGITLLVVCVVSLASGKQIKGDPSEAPDICSSADSDGVLVAHENCNQFYKCAHGIAIALICPFDHLYNPEKEYCDWPSNVNCGDRIKPNAAVSRGDQDHSQAASVCSSADSDGVLVAHENCNQFYKCAHGIAFALTCPFDHLYNPEKEYCDWPSNVNCGDRIKPNAAVSRGDQDHSQAASVCSSADSDGVLVAHENCNQFYKCAHGIAFALTCPFDHLYNPEKEYCDWPSNVNCGDRIKPNAAVSRGDQDHSQAASVCSSADSDGVLVAHENCNQFYKCAHGIAFALTCPFDHLYNPEKEYCDWPSNVNCGDRIKPNAAVSRGNQVHSDPSQAASICSSDDSDGVLVAHGNCNQFYKCAYGKPVPLDCPFNLLYNIDQEYCDWPANVQCGERQTPSKAVVRQALNVCASGYFGHVAHERCDAFYMCVAGHAIEIKCPMSLFYDTDKQVCNYASAVNCEGRITPSVNKHKAVARQLSKFESSVCPNAHWGNVAHERCDAYYMCVGGVAVELQCPLTLMYDPENKVCNHASALNCEGRLV